MRAAATVLFLLSLAMPAFAQGPLEPPIQGPPPPTGASVIARDERGRITFRTHRLPSPIALDGRLDEPFYETVPPFGDFVQQEPRQGQPSTERTDVWVFYDERNLYVSARLWESESGRRVATEMRRDANNLYNNDHFGVSFDGFYDRRNGYGFAVNAQGGMLDWAITNEQPNNNWNGVWMVRTGNFDHGWTIEIRFPFRSFRYREGGHTWGMNFRRMVRFKNEVSVLAPILASWGRPGMSRMSVAATATGIEVPPRPLNIDVKPYALGSVLTDHISTPTRDNDPNGDLGVDVKWGITQSNIADLTINTDFAQVEDDEQQVNLSRFNLQFPEKRDFFLEGADAFNFGSGSAGAGGTGGGGGVQGGAQNTSSAPLLFYSRRIGLNNQLDIPIVAGGRLLGRSGLWRYGVLNMQSAESAVAKSASTNFTVLRVNRDFLRRSRIGAMYTRRDPIATTAAGLDGPVNTAYGVDATINPTTQTSFAAYAARSVSPGKEGRDGSYRGRFDWTDDRYGIQAESLSVEPNFNPEVGFIRRPSFRRQYGQLRFSPRPRRLRGIRKVYYVASMDYITDIDNRPESKELQGTFQMDLDNGDTWTIDATRNYERLVSRFEVGKSLFVPAGEYPFKQVRGTYTFGQQRPVSGAVTAAYGSFYAGDLSEVTWRGRVELTRLFYLEPTLSWNRVTQPTGSANSDLVSTRATYTLTPRMFFSALAQYQSRTDSMSINARFRWEYIPGSELFVVYSDGRTTLNQGFPEVQNRSFVFKITRLLRW